MGEQLGSATFGRDPLSLLLVWPSSRQSVTSWSREFVMLFDGIGKIWYRKKSRNQSPKTFGTEKSLGTSPEKIWYREKSRNRSRKKFGAEKSPGIDYGKI